MPAGPGVVGVCTRLIVARLGRRRQSRKSRYVNELHRDQQDQMPCLFAPRMVRLSGAAEPITWTTVHLPALVREGFTGPTRCTQGTAAMAASAAVPTCRRRCRARPALRGSPGTTRPAPGTSAHTPRHTHRGRPAVVTWSKPNLLSNQSVPGVTGQIACRRASLGSCRRGPRWRRWNWRQAACG